MQFSIASLRLEHDKTLDRSDGHDKQRYDPLVCQCCGFVQKRPSDPTCLCDGLDWYMLPNGDVECQGHRLKRMIDGESRKRFWVFGRR